MMRGRKKKPPVQRTPHIERQKQSAFQYSSNRSQSDRVGKERNSEEKGTTLKKSARRSVYVLALVLVAIAAVYISLLSADPKLLIANEQQPLRDSYQKTVVDIAAKDFSSRSKLTINRKKISQSLQAEYPEITTADVTTPVFGRRAIIKVALANPALILNSADKSYVLDSQGVVLFDITSKNSMKTDSLLQINDQTQTPVIIGKPAFTSAQVNFIAEIKNQSQAKKMEFNTAIITAGGGELHVKHGGLPYIVKYSLYENPRKSFGTFIATKEQLDRSRLKPAEYIDVRVPERAYIK